MLVPLVGQCGNVSKIKLIQYYIHISTICLGIKKNWQYLASRTSCQLLRGLLFLQTYYNFLD